MVNSRPGLDTTFGALADPTRRAILARLAAGESSVSELAGPFDISLPAVSKHLRVLERAGLLARQKQGRVHRIRLNASPMREAAGWIARYRRFWEERFEALDRYLKETERKEETPWQPQTPPPKARSASRGRSEPQGKESSEPGRTRKR